MKTSGNTICITGGSTGIGAALAQRLHDRGDTVIITGRNEAAMAEVCAGRERLHARVLDVTEPAAVEAFATSLIADFPALNVLLNNAGIMKLEDVSRRRDLADAEDTITTNLLGPIRVTNALIDHLAGQPDAALINVSSGLAFVPLNAAPTYSATKAAIHSYTVNLREKLRGQVEVIELAPPGVQTALTPGQENRPGYLPLKDFIDEVMAQLEQQPTPREILVQRVLMLRNAEREGRFDDTLKQVNEAAEKARAASGG